MLCTARAAAAPRVCVCVCVCVCVAVCLLQVYKVDVLTDDNHWVVFRRYRQFHALHQKVCVREHVCVCVRSTGLLYTRTYT